MIIDIDDGSLIKCQQQVVVAFVRAVEDDRSTGISQFECKAIFASRYHFRPGTFLLENAAPGYLVVRLERVTDHMLLPVVTQALVERTESCGQYIPITNKNRGAGTCKDFLHGGTLVDDVGVIFQVERGRSVRVVHVFFLSVICSTIREWTGLYQTRLPVLRVNDSDAVYRSLFYLSNPSQQFRLLILLPTKI